jgi:hypothetical protein
MAAALGGVAANAESLCSPRSGRSRIVGLPVTDTPHNQHHGRAAMARPAMKNGKGGKTETAKSTEGPKSWLICVLYRAVPALTLKGKGRRA